MKYHFWIGLYEKGKFICYVGNKIKVNAKDVEIYKVIFNAMACKLDELYQPIKDEYIAFEYKRV